MILYKKSNYASYIRIDFVIAILRFIFNFGVTRWIWPSLRFLSGIVILDPSVITPIRRNQFPSLLFEQTGNHGLISNHFVYKIGVTRWI